MIRPAPVDDVVAGMWTEIADQESLDVQTRSGPVSSFGLAVKANIGVRGFSRSAGCRILDVRPEDSDAPVVAAFRSAGAVVLGMTNMHELGLGVTSDNAVYGAVRLPSNNAYSAGGSSGGSAAAVASGVVSFALGTDTGGSISIPASHCGVVGFRPSTGRWPTAGLVGLSWTRDTPGVFTTSVDDAIRADSWVTGSVRGVHSGRVRLGVPRELIADLASHTGLAFAAALERLSSVVELVEVSLASILDRTRRAEPLIVGWESRRELARAAADALGRDPEAAFTTLAARVASPDVAALLNQQLLSPISADQYASAQRDTVDARRLTEHLFASKRLDGLIFPTTPTSAPLIGASASIEHLGHQEALFGLYTRNTGPGTMLGTPMVTVPLPRSDDETPVGVTIQGLRHGDQHVLALAAALEPLLSNPAVPAYAISD
ncbi:amidase family protein [Microbacterium sp. LWO13-1.2]|uniref:amidase family protein n=1 Tax=Microbacterium sp. LWO13-1.2 TaxID=3135262 RepID=UPI00313A4B0F